MSRSTPPWLQHVPAVHQAGRDGAYFLLDGTVINGFLTGTWNLANINPRLRQRDLAHESLRSFRRAAVQPTDRTATRFRSRVHWRCWSWPCRSWHGSPEEGWLTPGSIGPASGMARGKPRPFHWCECRGLYDWLADPRWGIFIPHNPAVTYSAHFLHNPWYRAGLPGAHSTESPTMRKNVLTTKSLAAALVLAAAGIAPAQAAYISTGEGNDCSGAFGTFRIASSLRIQPTASQRHADRHQDQLQRRWLVRAGRDQPLYSSIDGTEFTFAFGPNGTGRAPDLYAWRR